MILAAKGLANDFIFRDILRNKKGCKETVLYNQFASILFIFLMFPLFFFCLCLSFYLFIPLSNSFSFQLLIKIESDYKRNSEL
jgi:hypothetical protein